jgi:dipeptidyl-peptidase 4
MKKVSLLCLSVIMALAQLHAARTFDLKELTSGTFSPEYLRDVYPLSDGENYTQISSDGHKILRFSFRTGEQTSVLFDITNVRGTKLDSFDGYIISPDGNKILIQTNTHHIYRHSFTATYYIYSVENNKLEPLSDGGPQQTPLFSPDGNQIAFVRDNNIFLVKLLFNNAESQVTKDGKYNEIINGIPDWVNEEEFSNDRSMVFNADGTMLCWIRYDESAVKMFSFPWYKGTNPEKKEYSDYPGEYTYKYPLPGYDNSKVAVYSFDIKAHQTRKMQLPLDADGYIPRIKMTSDAAKIAVFTMNRHQDKLDIYMVNPRSTVCQLAIHDQVDKYIKEESMENVEFTSNHILMPSERDGYNHLYLYNLNGHLVRSVCPEKAVVTELYGYDEITGAIYYAANPLGADDQQVYVSEKNGKITRLTGKSGINSPIFSSNYKYFINSWSDMNTPPVITICSNSGKVLKTLIDNKSLTKKLSAYDVNPKEKIHFTTSEGVALNGWMIKPIGFDAKKKYPVIMFQYGGPGVQQVLNKWGIGAMGQGGIYEEYLAQKGFVVVCVDGRGTGGRGADFEKCTYLRLGEKEARDQVETAIYLGSLPYVDKNRIGIWGWSYGGWNTLMSMSDGRSVFRAGVAVAPPTCWKFYDSVYTERYMRTPKENPSGYNDVNPIARASNLNGALLICHGFADDNVHFQNTAEYTEALVQADKDFKENFYTNRNHNITGGNTRNHLFRQITNFFIDQLK